MSKRLRRRRGASRPGPGIRLEAEILVRSGWTRQALGYVWKVRGLRRRGRLFAAARGALEEAKHPPSERKQELLRQVEEGLLPALRARGPRRDLVAAV